MNDFLVLSKGMVAKYGYGFAALYSVMDNFFTDGMKRGELKEDDFFHVPQEEISDRKSVV